MPQLPLPLVGRPAQLSMPDESLGVYPALVVQLPDWFVSQVG
jgi:hypothetical protein